MSGCKHATLYQRGRIWFVSYYRDGRRIQESTKTDSRRIADDVRRQRDAESLLESGDLERQVLRALRDPHRRDSVVAAALCTHQLVELKEAVARYLNHCVSFKRPKTIATDRGRLADFMMRTSVRNVTDVTPDVLCSYLAARSVGISPTTLLRTREVLHAFFRWAVEKMGYLPSNPVSKSPKPKPPQLDIDYLTIEEVAIALEAVRGDVIEAIVAAAIYAGARREEITWLTWTDVDLRAKLLKIRTKSIDGETWMPKTRRNRIIPVSSDLLPFLLEQRMKHPVWVFPSPEGTRWDPDNLSHRLRKLMKAAGKSWSCLSFRHTFGSLLAQNGVSFDKIADYMGNSAAIVRRHYAALRPEQGHDDVEFRIDRRSEKA